MLEVAGEELQTTVMDHHGLVAAVCKDLKIAERIDRRLGVDSQRIVSPGMAVVAMILNGLGFTNRRLYLTPQFFETKPVDVLIGEGIQAKDLTDYTLGHTLDEIAKYGASNLFGEVSFETALENDLLGELNHLDTTSLSVHGEYAAQEKTGVIELTHGHSKDHRPDLKQAVLSLVVNGAAAVPLFMEPLNGNSSDKASFHETIKKVRNFQSQVDQGRNFKWVADSALYGADKLLKNNDYTWLTRVPETLKEARILIEKSIEEIEWEAQGGGYQLAPFTSHYGGIEQRWILVFSQQAYEREKKTLDRNLKNKDEEIKKALWHLSNEIFECEKDAQKSFNTLAKKYKLHVIKGQIVPVLKYTRRGKPKAGESKTMCGYRIESTVERNAEEIERALNRKGRFILATNDLDKESYPDAKLLKEYKDQQKVEGGFRFLKDPWFMVDSIFLKSPHRIEALMMVMTLCLLVYNIAQYQLRQRLQKTNETLPNQLGKPIQTPTLRWIFQIMEGVAMVKFYKGKNLKLMRTVITNLNEIRRKIILLFGDTACQIYGVIQQKCPEGLGM